MDEVLSDQPKTPGGTSGITNYQLATEDTNDYQYRLLSRRLNRSPYTLYPDGMVRVAWDYIMAAAILFECIALPFLLPLLFSVG